MLVIGRDRPSEPAALRRDRIAHPIIRKTLARAKSLGPILYLVSVGVIATWVIGIFFGVGFFFLVHHHSENDASRLGIGGVHLSASLAESPWVLQSMTGPDRLFPQPFEVASGDWDLTVAAPDKKNIAMEGRPLLADLETIPRVLGELSPFSRPPSQPSDAIGPSSAAQSPQSASPHKPSQARPTNTRTSQPHAPVQAIQELLQKHSQLLK